MLMVSTASSWEGSTVIKAFFFFFLQNRQWSLVQFSSSPVEGAAGLRAMCGRRSPFYFSTTLISIASDDAAVAMLSVLV